MENQIAQIANGYQLQGQIGRGGFGVVYRAYQVAVNRDVAVKVIQPQYANQPDFIRRFEIEAQLVARLEHPHIVPLYDYWRDPTGAYLVMRYMRGGSLQDWLQQHGALELDAALRVTEQISFALALAHQRQIVHRDIKPGNILLDEDRNAYLTDFGIAKVVTGKTSHDADETFSGSMQYVAPEQLKSLKITPQADIYALGLVLYEMLTGEYAFGASTPSELLYKHLETPLPDIHRQRPEIPEAVTAVIHKATCKNPVERYVDTEQLLTALRESLTKTNIKIPSVEIDTAYPLVETLTDRELEVLQLMAQGLSNREVATKLVLEITTVKWHVRQIFGKLGAHRRREAIAVAKQRGLLEGTPHLPTGVLQQILPVAPNPYKGLRSFQQADVHDFFGREGLTQRLLVRLGGTSDSSRFLAVVGPSGSGKSSVVRAGLLPILQRGGVNGSENWFIADMLPGTHPLDELEVALTRIAATPGVNIGEQLERDERGLLRVAQMVLSENSELLLLVDQFEEVFTLCDNEDHRQYFLALLATTATQPRSRVRVVITLRADFYDRPLLYPVFGELVRQNMETILPMSPSELEQAICTPARQAGVMVEAGLAAEMVADVSEQPGALPLLQYALTELYDRRQGRVMTLDIYNEIGGVMGALTRRADDIYAELNTEEQEAMRQLFLRLVTLGEGTEDIRRRVLRSELQTISDDSDLMDELMDLLTDFRLLTLDSDPVTREPTVEVAHEAILREWRLLRTWLEDSLEDLHIHRRMTQATTEWIASGYDTGFLAQEARLILFESWAAQTSLSLNRDEQAYLEASIANRVERDRIDQERKAREAETARRAEQYEHRARQFRWAAALFGTMVVLAVIATVVAVLTTHDAQSTQATVESISTYSALERGRAGTLAAGGVILPPEENLHIPALFAATSTRVAELNHWEPVVQVFDGVEMVLVPAGCFMMGSIYHPDEQPIHEICFEDPFWIDRYEVTLRAYADCVATGICPEMTGARGRTSDLEPVNRASWFQAQTYCEWRGGRLPTEAEWEYAARGPDSLIYPWGNEFVADNVVFADNASSKVADVGTRPGGVSWVGAQDMSGNVWEWTSTIFQPYPYRLDDGRENNADLDSARVLRGGAYVDAGAYLRTAYRYKLAPDHQGISYFSSGFRCARPDQP